MAFDAIAADVVEYIMEYTEDEDIDRFVMVCKAWFTLGVPYRSFTSKPGGSVLQRQLQEGHYLKTKKLAYSTGYPSPREDNCPARVLFQSCELSRLRVIQFSADVDDLLLLHQCTSMVRIIIDVITDNDAAAHALADALNACGNLLSYLGIFGLSDARIEAMLSRLTPLARVKDLMITSVEGVSGQPWSHRIVTLFPSVETINLQGFELNGPGDRDSEEQRMVDVLRGIAPCPKLRSVKWYPPWFGGDGEFGRDVFKRVFMEFNKHVIQLNYEGREAQGSFVVVDLSRRQTR